MIKKKEPKVMIVMGSDSDLPVLKGCIRLLKNFEIEMEVLVCSAHRSPDRAAELAKTAESCGFDVIVAAAGKAAHLPGVLAAYTVLPVIGIPIKADPFDGLDSLLSIVQMPQGIPVATVAVDGAENAAILAAQILSVGYPNIRNKILDYKSNLNKMVQEKNEKLQIALKDM